MSAPRPVRAASLRRSVPSSRSRLRRAERAAARLPDLGGRAERQAQPGGDGGRDRPDRRLLVASEPSRPSRGKVAQIRPRSTPGARRWLPRHQKVDRLTVAPTRPKERADILAARAAQLIAQLAPHRWRRPHGGLLIGSASTLDQLLSRLGTMNRLPSRRPTSWRARSSTRTWPSRSVAGARREDPQAPANEAEAALAIAQRRRTRRRREVAASRRRRPRCMRSSRRLKETTAPVEQRLSRGPRQGAAAEQPAEPAGEPAEREPDADPPVGGAVEQAIAYARAQLGEPYAFGGAGPGWLGLLRPDQDELRLGRRLHRHRTRRPTSTPPWRRRAGSCNVGALHRR